MTDLLESSAEINVPGWAPTASAAALILLALFILWFAYTHIYKFRLRRNVKAVFKAYLAAERHPHLRRVFKSWMKSEGEEKVIWLLSETYRGEEFEPNFGKSFLENNGALLRELTGETEWYARYFAYKILIHDTEEITQRSLESGLLDPHPLVRKILTENFIADRIKTWEMLWEKLIHDPVYEVRATARKRITKEFMDIYSLKNKGLNAEEAFRVLELLDPNSQEDKTFAMSMLQSENREIRYPAAVFLQKCGILDSYLAKNTLDDSANIESSVRLLKKAMDVNVSGFLADYPTNDGGPLLVAASLLAKSSGSYESVNLLVKKVFNFFDHKKIDPSNREIYTKTLDAISNRGNIESYELLAEELTCREKDHAFLELILPRVPAKGELIFSPILFRFLENVHFPARNDLVKTLGTFSADIILPEVFHILNSGRIKFPHKVRISALQILGLLRQPYCLQKILESLPTLTEEEIKEFALLISDYPNEIFEDKAKAFFALPDARIRASLISILPVVKNESFMKEIRSSLKDVDPDVRVAAIKALLEFGETKLLNQETSMLRDPIERVRLATAEIIAKHGNNAAMEILKDITVDPNETEVVKIGVIAGLGQAANAESIQILVSILDSQEEFRGHAAAALSMRITKRDISELIEIFKNAEPQLREKLIPVFKGQGKNAESRILEILKEEVASLKPYLVKILEETGYVDEAKKRLSNRNVEVRREAAETLSLLDTLPAFRGLVMAAKDPDQEVRVCVVKALEKLKSSKSRDMLENLKQDPDARVRKYTHWALERLDSLAME